MRRGHYVICLAMTASGLGCGPAPSPPVSAFGVDEPHRVSPPLLLSEVQEASRPADLLNADFTLQNRSSSPTSVSLAATSCSCYGVLLDGRPWEKGDAVTLPPGRPRLLTFDVSPPTEPSEKSWSIRLASGSDPPEEQVLSLEVRVYRDVIRQPEAFFITIPPSSTNGEDRRVRGSEGRKSGGQRVGSRRFGSRRSDFNHSGPPRRLVVTRTWRKDEGPSAAPRLTDLPVWASFSPPVEMDAPQEVAAGLWRQSWETELALGPMASGGRESPDERASGGRESPDERIGGLTPPRSPLAGVHQFHVRFDGPGSKTVGASGRIVLDEVPGVTAPSVVHWGRVSQHRTRTRRMVLSSGDDRPFRIEGARLITGDEDAEAPAGPIIEESEVSGRSGGDRRSEGRRSEVGAMGRPTSDPPTADTPTSAVPDAAEFRFDSPQMILTVRIDTEASAVRQHAALELSPQRPGPLNATLVFDTDHPLTPSLEIDLRAFVLEASAAAEAPGGG